MIYHLLRRMVAALFRALFLVEVKGAENIPITGGLLMCANHKSNFDPVMIACFVPRKLNFMAKQELFKIPLFSGLIRLFGAFPIRRGAADAAAVKKSIDLLKNERALLIFPQGTRKDEVKPGDFKHGAAVIAAKSGAVILPVGISGRYRLFGRPVMRFGKPIPPSQYLPSGEDEGREYIERINDILYVNIKELTKP